MRGCFDPLLGWKSLLPNTVDFLGGEGACYHSCLLSLSSSKSVSIITVCVEKRPTEELGEEQSIEKWAFSPQNFTSPDVLGFFVALHS